MKKIGKCLQKSTFFLDLFLQMLYNIPTNEKGKSASCAGWETGGK